MRMLKIVVLGVVSVGILGCSKMSPVAVSSDEQNLTNTVQVNTDDYIRMTTFAKTDAPFGAGYKWHHRNIILPKQSGKLYWYIDSPCKDAVDARAAVRQAFAFWQSYVPFTFTESTTTAGANIVIRFIDNANAPLHNGATPWWSGDYITLGWGYSPYETTAGTGWDFFGDVMINDYFVDWGKNPLVVKKPGATGTFTINSTLVKVLTHELGHAMGLDHDATATKNIMNPQGPFTNGNIYDADVKSISQLYNMQYQIVYGNDYANKMVKDAFSRILKGVPSSTELTTYSTKLAWYQLPSKRNYTYQQLLIDIAGSAAAWTKATRITKTFITNSYVGLLNRQPTTAELSAWDLKMKSGATTIQVAQGLVKSTEWNTNYVKSVYSTQLGATVSATVLNTYVTKLTNETIEPFGVLWAVTTSSDYFNKCLPKTNGGLITRMYQTVLGVSPTSNQYSSWLNWID